MDRISVSETLDLGSIPNEATKFQIGLLILERIIKLKLRNDMYFGLFTFLTVFCSFGCYASVNRDNGEDKISFFKGTPVDSISDAIKLEDTIRIANFFTEKFDKINYQEPKFGYTLLLWSIANKKYNSCNALLKAGADPNLTTIDGHSPLIYSAQYGNFDYVKLLVKYGANINYLMDSLPPATALIASISATPSNDDYEKVKFLVEHGANIDATNRDVSTPVNYAVILKSFEILEYLIFKGAKTDKPVNILPNGRQILLYEKIEKLDVSLEFVNRKKKLLKYIKKKSR